MKSMAFLAFVIFSLVLCFLLVDALCAYGWKHSCLYIGLAALALLVRGGFRLFYAEN